MDNNNIYPLDKVTHGADETERVGSLIARSILDDRSIPRFVALYGDLGVGKTAFTRGFVSVISPQSTVRSPTFTLVNEYRGGTVPVFHFDMYRINSEDDLYSIGFDEYPDRGICVVEWSEKIGFALPQSRIQINIEKDNTADTESRHIRAEIIR